MILFVLLLIIFVNSALSLSSLSSSSIAISSSRRMLSLLPRQQSSSLYLLSNNEIEQAFNVATFIPQPFWMLMILIPNSNITKKVMTNWYVPVFFAFVHLFIVIVSATQQDGTAPIAEFSDVFNPNGQPLQAMIHMMTYPNFVSEEWSHVLTWDLIIGMLIYQDGLRRNIFTPHSVLLTNLIGPPGLLLHLLTCSLFKKGLPPILSFEESSSSSLSSSSSSEKDGSSTLTASYIVYQYFPTCYQSKESADKLLDAMSDDVVYEYCGESEKRIGKDAVSKLLMSRIKVFESNNGIGPYLTIDKVVDGKRSSGFTWYLQQSNINGKGLRGITFISINSNGKVDYIREVDEPLFKPGSVTSKLLRSIVESNIKKSGIILKKNTSSVIKRIPSSASDAVNYLWKEVNGSSKDLVLDVFDDSITYNDYNFEQPFVGIKEVSEFIDEFNIPGIEFIPEQISEGELYCCFTWRVQIAGVEQATRGISFYEFDKKKSKIVSIIDIPEPAIKPAPLQVVASIFKPGLRRFQQLL